MCACTSTYKGRVYVKICENWGYFADCYYNDLDSPKFVVYSVAVLNTVIIWCITMAFFSADKMHQKVNLEQIVTMHTQYRIHSWM